MRMFNIGKDLNDRKVLRQKRFLKGIHSNILKAKDNVGKNKKKERQRSHAKISTRLPQLALGMYRNGAKGEDIQKEALESMFNIARMKSDALKLFNDDISEYRGEPSTHNETINQSSNNNFVQNSPEQSAIFEKKLRRILKSHDFNISRQENYKENVIEKVPYRWLDNDFTRILEACTPNYLAQKEKKFKSLHNAKKEELKHIASQMRMPDNFMNENENITPQILEDNKNLSRELKCYKEVCNTASYINFGGDFQNDKPDPFMTTIKELQYAYSSRKQNLFTHLENKNSPHNKYTFRRRQWDPMENRNIPLTDSNKYSHVSLPSTSAIDYEVPSNNEYSSEEEGDKFYLMQSDNAAHYGSTSRSSQDSVVPHNTDNFIMKNRKNNDNLKQSADIHQPAASCSFVNEEDSVQKDFHYIDHPSKNERYEDHFSFDFSENAQHSHNTICSNLFAKNSLEDYTGEQESAIDFSTRITNIDNCNAKNVEQSVIWHNNIAKRDRSVERSDENLYDKAYKEGLYEETDTDNESLDNERHAYADSFHDSVQFLREKNKRETVNSHLSMKYEDREIRFRSRNAMCEDVKIPGYNNIFEPFSRKYESQREGKFHSLGNFPTPVPFPMINKQLVNFHDRIETSEPQIESMELKDSEDSQESLINRFTTNMRPNKYKLNGRNKFDNLQTFEASYNTDSYTERLIREQTMPLKKRLLHHLRNNRDHSGCSSNNNNSVQSTKLLPQQPKLYTSKNDDGRQEFLENDIRNVDVIFNNSKAMSHPSLTLKLNKRLREPRYEKIHQIVDKADVEYAMNQANSCLRDKRYIYLDSTDQQKYNFSQARHFYEGAAQPGILQIEDHNRDNYVNLSDDLQSMPNTLYLERKYVTHPKMHDDRAVLLQDVTQPVKYFAANINSNIQRMPVYRNDDGSIIKSIPVKVITRAKSNAQGTEESYFYRDNNLQRE